MDKFIITKDECPSPNIPNIFDEFEKQLDAFKTLNAKIKGGQQGGGIYSGLATNIK